MTHYLLIHGLPDHSGTWEKLEPLLEASHRNVMRVGLPGIDDDLLLDEHSSLEQLADLLILKIPPGNYTLIGHDFGGILGSLIAGRRPDLVSGLVMINGPAAFVLRDQIRNDPDQTARSKYAEKIITDPEKVLSAKDFSFLKSFLFKEEIGASKNYRDSLMENWRRPEKLKNIGTYYRGFLNGHFTSLTLSMPSLQIWSQGDPFLGPGVQARMKNEFPLHQVVEIPTDSHWPQISHPELIFATIEKFENPKSLSTRV